MILVIDDVSKAKRLAKFVEDFGYASIVPNMQLVDAANYMRALIEFYEERKEPEDDDWLTYP